MHLRINRVYSLLSINLVFLLLFVTYTKGSLYQLCAQMNYFYKYGKYLDCIMYVNYGCWCGPGGSGTPVDGSDACCRTHDHCYDRILKNETCDPYLDNYKFKDGKCRTYSFLFHVNNVFLAFLTYLYVT